MPAEYALGNKDHYVRSIHSSMPMFSPDGRFGREGPEIALKVLREFDARRAAGVRSTSRRPTPTLSSTRCRRGRQGYSAVA